MTTGAGGPDIEELLEFIRDTRGFDFTGYKRSSVQRRVERRMRQVGIDQVGDYLDLLQADPGEFTQLFNTILINVTRFLRDPDAWKELREEVLPAPLARKPRGESVRVWSAGCASGEEAYGLAMLLAEALGVEEFRRRVKVYATDVDEDALAIARQATYTEDDLEEVPAEWRERYFVRSGERWTFRPDLRRSVIFGRNDLVQDAPIGRLDMLVCRNTLMYLNAGTQAQVLRRFGFALAPTGVLFLGRAEILLNHAELFVPLDAHRRFFRKADRPPTGTVTGSSARAAAATVPAPVDEVLLASPLATVVLAGDDTVLLGNRSAESRLGVGPRDVGRPFGELEPGRRILGLRTSLEDVRRTRAALWQHEAEYARTAGETAYYDIHLVPLDPDGRTVAIFFTDVTRHHRMAGELQDAHQQVENAYEELQSTVEELETTNEELQSTVEELETTNEELQSTVEELETTNEELQSANDELRSANDELRDRTDELDRAGDVLESVLGGLRTAVVVVDTALMVRAWNDRATDLWGLRQDEAVGQHLLNLDLNVSTERLRPIVRTALAGDRPGEPIRLEAINRRGRPVQLVVSASPLVPRGGDPTGVIVLMDEVGPPGVAP
ncbi:PAS domain-containing protein [Pseudonocardia sp. C8]|uniref:CheR family methyltransferase n=1 Tax=Pseudonocardia sp. C8 TaxID=2762759 RepID=UPI0016429800|nr:CheR family methyltransferase [Pseudonocardia sp. C8]MBC3191952.1 PAS domain-containing protein [Pseudonocardia sp. C8]